MIDIKLNNSGVRFDEVAHRYFLNGKELFGITKALERQLGFEYPNVPQSVLDAAAERGHAIHSAIEAYYEFGGESAQWAEYVFNFREMTENHGLQVVCNEYVVTDFTNYASPIDVVFVKDNGHIVIGDIKTTSKIHHEKVRWQLSIYAYFFHLLNPDLVIDGICCIWLPTKKNYGHPKIEWYDIIDELECMTLLDCDARGVQYQPSTDLVPTKEQAHAMKVKALEEAIVQCVREEAEAKARKNQLTETIRAACEEYGIKSFSDDTLSISYIAAHTQTKFDAKSFKEDNPELYDQYLKESEVKAAVKINIKKPK